MPEIVVPLLNVSQGEGTPEQGSAASSPPVLSRFVFPDAFVPSRHQRKTTAAIFTLTSSHPTHHSDQAFTKARPRICLNFSFPLLLLNVSP